MRFRFMRGRSLRRAWRWRRRRWSRRRALSLLLPGVEFGLLILLVLSILLHRRSLSYQRMSRRRMWHRWWCWARRLRLTCCFLGLRGSGSCAVRWWRRMIVCRLLWMRRLVGLHCRRLRPRGFSWSSRRLSRSWRPCRCTSRRLRLSWSLCAYVRLRSVRLSKRRARRRRLPGRNHLSVHHRGRRLYSNRPASSHDTLTGRLHRDVVDHGSILDLPLIHFGKVGLNRTRARESLM
jgi:hypothetical protein